MRVNFLVLNETILSTTHLKQSILNSWKFKLTTMLTGSGTDFTIVRISTCWTTNKCLYHTIHSGTATSVFY